MIDKNKVLEAVVIAFLERIASKHGIKIATAVQALHNLGAAAVISNSRGANIDVYMEDLMSSILGLLEESEANKALECWAQLDEEILSAYKKCKASEQETEALLKRIQEGKNQD